MPDGLLIRDGLVVDGTGTPSKKSDILVVGDRVAAVGGDLPDDGQYEEIDAAGMTVTPGFVDLHSHADFSLLAFPSAASALRQGITTVVTGNCGGGVAPLADPAQVGSVAFGYSPDWEVEVDWLSFGDYHTRLDGTAINVAPLVAQGVIRNLVMGMAAREPSASELDRMCDLLRQCLDEGAFGMSTGLEYQPGIWTNQAENRRLVAEVGNRGGLYATHMRGRAEDHADATTEALVTARGTGAHLQLSHFAPRPNAPRSASERAFQLVAEAVENDQPVGVDTFPEIWGPALLIDLFPEWALEGSHEEVRNRLRAETSRAALRDHFATQPEFLARVAGYAEIYVADAPGNPDLSGVSLTAIAERNDQNVADTCCDILLAAEDEYRSVAIRHVYATESDLRRVMELPYCSIESDGVVTAGEGVQCPLIWNASSYGYVPRVIEHYVLEVGLFSLSEAVRRMTSLPAETVGLVDRGTLEVGSYADLVVIDTNDLRDLSTPQDPARHPQGVRLVLVNGEKAVVDDRITESRSGRALQK